MIAFFQFFHYVLFSDLLCRHIQYLSIEHPRDALTKDNEYVIRNFNPEYKKKFLFQINLMFISFQLFHCRQNLTLENVPSQSSLLPSPLVSFESLTNIHP